MIGKALCISFCSLCGKLGEVVGWVKTHPTKILYDHYQFTRVAREQGLCHLSGQREELDITEVPSEHSSAQRARVNETCHATI